MKFTALAKATLAIGILTTGVITAESQTGHAKVELDETQRKYYINMLHQYYSEESFEPTNISVKSEDYYGSNVLNFKQRNKAFKVFLLGDDKNKYKEKTHGLDVFAVPELIDIKGGIYSVGGITKKNVRSVFGFVSNPSLQVKKVDAKNGFLINELFFIQKEEVSLKELDFKIRKLLIEKYRLYKGTADKGRIVINMKDEKKHEIDLSEKLSFERMFDVMDSKKIKNIEVNLN
ncbi:superantigen-like protein SSL9 [Staphylococcus aureus]|uniref:superantigen-like protein SSL9 n=1 Tax=Staphylococcus aureus TaxID=1280 RepID=UPI0013A6C6A4|nr:superantigen-like protein SSL9 [Staphylococcus aureus]NDR16810.1 superantigen-like protein SSL9 [Staphylococcus aureus]